jgi:hypothetical protein
MTLNYLPHEDEPKDRIGSLSSRMMRRVLQLIGSEE